MPTLAELRTQRMRELKENGSPCPYAKATGYPEASCNVTIPCGEARCPIYEKALEISAKATKPYYYMPDTPERREHLKEMQYLRDNYGR